MARRKKWVLSGFALFILLIASAFLLAPSRQPLSPVPAVKAARLVPATVICGNVVIERPSEKKPC